MRTEMAKLPTQPMVDKLGNRLNIMTQRWVETQKLCEGHQKKIVELRNQLQKLKDTVDITKHLGMCVGNDTNEGVAIGDRKPKKRRRGNRQQLQSQEQQQEEE